MDKKNQAKKLPGFYIALCCCVLGIGVAGFVAQKMESSTTNALTEVIETVQPIPTAASTVASLENTSDNSNIAESTIQNRASNNIGPEINADVTEDSVANDIDDNINNNNTAAVSVASISNNETNTELLQPLSEMDVIYQYYGDTLVYNELLESWHTHAAIDLSANLGESVCATADGTVESIRNGSMGNEITISHNNGLKTVYAQLGDICVSEGDSIAGGSVIGIIAESRGETVRKPHLHYEVIKDGKHINPTEM